MTEFSAALIAGGRSRRMGTDKAFLAWQERPLWEHQIEKLRSLGPQEMLLSCRPDQPFPPASDVMSIYDAWPDCGPLGGIASCLRVCASPLLVVLGIDLPLLPVAFLKSLLANCTPGCGAAVSMQGDRESLCYEPLGAVYPLAMRELAEAQITAGRLSMQEFIRLGIERGLMRPAQIHVENDWFTNLNSPDDMP